LLASGALGVIASRPLSSSSWPSCWCWPWQPPSAASRVLPSTATARERMMLGAPHPSHQATDGRSLRLDHGRPEDATNPTTNTTLEPDRGAKGTVASEGVGRWDRRAHTEHAGLLVTAPALPVPGRPTPTRHSTGAPMPTITWGAQVASQQRRARPHPSNLVHESRPADPQHRMTSGALTGGAACWWPCWLGTGPFAPTQRGKGWARPHGSIRGELGACRVGSSSRA